MLQEALQLIQETAVQAEAACIMKLPGDDRKIYVQQGKEWREYDVQPEPRKHTVHTLADLILYVNESGVVTDGVVWHDTIGVVLVINDTDRCDTVTFPLTLSERFRKLQKLAAEKPAMQQDRFVKLLRLELGVDPLIIAKFRKLDWEAGDKGTSDVRHGDTRLAKSVIAKVQGIEELPEELVISVPVYQQTGERDLYDVRCDIEIDARNQQFQLVPKPDELERVLDLAQASIRERLSDELKGVDVYYGRP